MNLKKITQVIDLLTSEDFAALLKDYKNLKEKCEKLEKELEVLYEIVAGLKEFQPKNINDLFKKVL